LLHVLWHFYILSSPFLLCLLHFISECCWICVQIRLNRISINYIFGCCYMRCLILSFIHFHYPLKLIELDWSHSRLIEFIYYWYICCMYIKSSVDTWIYDFFLFFLYYICNIYCAISCYGFIQVPLFPSLLFWMAFDTFFYHNHLHDVWLAYTRHNPINIKLQSLSHWVFFPFFCCSYSNLSIKD